MAHPIDYYLEMDDSSSGARKREREINTSLIRYMSEKVISRHQLILSLPLSLSISRLSTYLFLFSSLANWKPS
jgi:hypothetical protein